MKKIFTLIAVAAMAINANAQESYAVGSLVPTDNQEVQATESIKLTYGADGQWQNKENGEVEPFTAFVTGGANPVDGSDPAVGYSADNKKLPVKGTYYIIEAAKAGTMVFWVQLNANKEFYVVDGVEGTNLNENINASFVQVGETEPMTPTTGGKGGLVLADKLKGSVTFTIPAAGKYYVFCTGSKLGFYGFTFTAGGESGIASVKAAKANAAEYNLAGQKVAAGFKGLVIKEGKKVIK